MRGNFNDVCGSVGGWRKEVFDLKREGIPGIDDPYEHVRDSDAVLIGGAFTLNGGFDVLFIGINLLMTDFRRPLNL